MIYDDIDMKNSHSAGFYAGLVTGICVSAAVVFLVKVFLIF